MKNLKLLVDQIEKLQDKNHRLLIENDLLRNEIAETVREIKRAA